MGRPIVGTTYGRNWEWALRSNVIGMHEKPTGEIVIIGHNRLQSEKHLEYVRDHIREWIPTSAGDLHYTPTTLTLGSIRIVTAKSFDCVAVKRDVVVFDQGSNMGIIAERILTDEWRGYRPHHD